MTDAQKDAGQLHRDKARAEWRAAMNPALAAEFHRDAYRRTAELIAKMDEE